MYKINNSNFQFFSSEKLHHNLSIQLRIPTLPCLPKNAFFPLEYFFALNILSGSFKFSCLTVFWPSLHHRCIQNPVKHLGLSVFAKNSILDVCLGLEYASVHLEILLNISHEIFFEAM